MPYVSFLLIVLAAVSFFNYHAILSEQAAKAIFYLSVLAGGVVAYFPYRTVKIGNFPRGAWFMLMGGIVISIFMAPLYHKQSLPVSMMTTLPTLFAYFTFPIFLRFNIPVERVIRAYMVLAVVSAFVYFCNVMTMPNNIFGKPIIDLDMTRGIVRIPLVFIEVFPILVFYCVNRWLDDKKAKWLWFILFLMTMIVLSVVRQVIVYTAILSVLFIMRKVSWKVKAAMCLGIVGVIVYVLPMIPIYKTMVELSEEQVDENEDEENIRITAWRYYTYENQSGDLTPFLGNGMPSFGNSIWGISFDAETEENGCFYVDVGWAGMYWLFGPLAVGGLLWLMIVTLIKKKPENLQFVNYGIVFIFLTNFTSAPTIYYYQIVNVTMLLSIPYCICNQSSSEAVPAEALPRKRTSLMPRFPQLR